MDANWKLYPFGYDYLKLPSRQTHRNGEGGAVLTRNKLLYDRLLMFRSHGITKNRIDFTGTGASGQGEWYYEMQFLGYNYRMTDIQAALGYSQLTKIKRFIEARREIAVYYNNVLSG